MNPIVFLDIDGVLNSPKNYHEWYMARDAAPETVTSLMPHGQDPHVLKLFDGENVRHLNTITSAVDAKIVISSSWRFSFDMRENGEAELGEILKNAGVTAEVLGFTPPKNRHRGDAIRQWLSERCPAGGTERTVFNIAILDDCPPKDFPRMSGWLVETDGATGLTAKDVEKARRIFRKPWMIGRKRTAPRRGAAS